MTESQNPYESPRQASSKRAAAPSDKASIFWFVGTTLTIVFLGLLGVQWRSAGLPMNPKGFLQAFVMAGAFTVVATGIYALINGLLPRSATILSRAISAIVFCSTTFGVAELLTLRGYSGVPGLITLPSAIIATIVVERLTISTVAVEDG